MARIELLEQELDLAGAHSAVLPNGKVLFFAADPPRENDVNVSLFQLWDEENGPVRSRDAGLSLEVNRNLFCSGHCFLPDGRLLIAGGQSSNFGLFGAGASWIPVDGADHDIHSFDFNTAAFTRHEDMPSARYYPTCVTLPDGNALICSGAWNRITNQINHEAEIFFWETNIKGDPFSFNPGFIETMYPFLQVLPDEDGPGRLFVFSKNKARLFELGSWEWRRRREFTAFSDKNRNYPHQGSCVLLPFHMTDTKLRIMVIGGEGATHDEATDTAEIFDYDLEDPGEWRWRDPAGGGMANKRFMGDAVIMADGTILLVNGAEEGAADHSAEPVMEAELFDPDSETWTTSESLSRRRMYHSTALLLPSGRVLMAGNTERWNPENPVEEKTVELFIPDYADSASRPTITNAPREIFYGASFQISTPDARAIRKVALIRASSTTHTNNMDQRYLTLDFQLVDNRTLRANAPAGGAVAPPGHYMLVILDGDRIPSVAKFMTIKPSPADLETTITVRESAGDVDTGIMVEPGDQVTFSATGTIWAGVNFTDRNGPRGWNNVDHDTKFPLNRGDNAHPYCLIGKFGRDGNYFYVGDACTKVLDSARRRRLFLRTNDDAPGNGNGRFHCRVKVTRRLNLPDGAVIARVVANPPGLDLAPGGGEHVVIKNVGSNAVNLNGWVLTDVARHEIVIGDYTLQPGAELFVFTARGTNTANRFFAGRVDSAILNNDGDTIRLLDANRKLVSMLTY